MPQDNERIAVLEKAVEGFEKGVSRLESKLDSLFESIERKFVPRHEYETLKEDIKEMKERNNKIVGGLITAIVTLGAAMIASGKFF